MVQRLQDNHSCPFSHHEAIAIPVVGTRSAGRIIIEIGRKRTQSGKARQRYTVHRRFRTPSNHDVGIAKPNQAGSITDGMGSSRAGVDARMVRTFQPEPNRHEAGRQIDDTARDKKWRPPPGALLVQRDSGFRNTLDAADARTYQYARDGLFVISLWLPPCIV